MDADLIKLVNKLQDTFANLGEYDVALSRHIPDETAGGELDMPQLAVVCLRLEVQRNTR